MSLKPYPTYKDSGVAWLGQVPEHWEIWQVKRGFKRKKEPNSGMKCDNRLALTMRGVVPRSLDDLEGLQANEFETYQIFEAGDLAFKLIDLQNIKTSRVGLVAEKGIMSPAYIRLEPSKGVNCKFAYWFFTDLYNRQIFNELGGGVRQTIGQEELLVLDFLFPALTEQSIIAAFLDRETGKIDELIAEQEKLIALLTEKRQATISDAVTKGRNTGAPMKDSGIEWLGQIPAHWKVEKAKYLFSKSSLPPPVDAEVVTCFRDGQVTLRRNRREDGFTFAILEHGYQGITPGQLVLHSMDAFAGAIGVSDSFGKCSPEYLVCDPKYQDISAEYYGLLLRLMSLRGFILAACPSVRERAPRIRFPDFGEMLLPVPPSDEQRAILAAIRRSDEQTKQLVEVASEAITLMKERRTALISAAVTGKIDVRQPSAEIIDLAVVRRRMRGLMAVELIEKSQGRATFGRTALQKHAYLAEVYAGVQELGGRYVRNDYGPLDRDMIDDMESGAQELCGIVTQPPTGTNRSVTYLLSRQTGAISNELAQQLGPDRSAKLKRLHALLASLNTHDVEGVATLFAVWNDFLIEHKAPSDDDIINGFLNDWHPRKSENFNSQELRLRLDWMRRNGLVPTGAGPKTETGRLFV